MKSKSRAELTLGCVLVACGLGAAQQAQRKPNVVLVMTDDQGYGDIGALGNSVIRTPNIDKLCKRSVRLTNFHVDPTCSPTRSALMTGRYSTRTGVWHTIMGRSLMRSSEVTLGEMFKAGGYKTAMFGKWHLGENWPLRPQDQGFDEAFYHGGGGVGQGPDWWGNDYFDDTYFRNGKPEKVDGYCTDVWFANAIRFIEAHRAEPFFVYLPTNAAHGPYRVDDRYAKPYRDRGVPETMAKFYGMIANIDENLGKLVAKLDSLGLTENTIFVFMTDNGTAAGFRPRGKSEWRGFNAGMRGTKGSEYDGGHRVPCFISWPAGKLGSGREVSQLAAHIDILPTLRDLCGLEVPDGPHLDGASLVAALRGDKKALRERTLFVHSQRVPDPIKWRKCSVMTERWRYVDGKELYDMIADPGQREDVAAAHPAVVERLRSAYEDWWLTLMPVFGERVRIGLGSEAEPVTRLHPHDWHVKSQRSSSWHQNHVRRGHLGNGFWAVDVTRAGRYEVVLRRWPEQQPGPIEAVRARLRCGAVDVAKKTDKNARLVRFEVDLERGPQRLQTWLTLESGKTRGAYFVRVRRVD